MNFLEALILWSLKKLNSERTVYSVFHLLKGKKSSQTIQDAYLYKIGVLFYTFPNLTRKSFDHAIQSLINHSFITVNPNFTYSLSDKGETNLQDYFYKHPFPQFLNGLKHQENGFLFWKRLVMIVQVVSNSINENRQYSPILREPDLLIWVKRFMKAQDISTTQLSTYLFEELNSIFSKNPPENPELLVVRLTGYKQIGKTIEQAAESFGYEVTYYWYRYLNLLHFVMDTIIKGESEYPILQILLQDVNKPLPLTRSTYETYKLLLKNYTVEQISTLRKLKESTIQDHIIEIALTNPNFNVKEFIDSEMEDSIIRIAKELGGHKLKPIKDALENVSYFQIRLALAKNR